MTDAPSSRSNSSSFPGDEIAQTSKPLLLRGSMQPRKKSRNLPATMMASLGRFRLSTRAPFVTCKQLVAAKSLPSWPGASVLSSSNPFAACQAETANPRVEDKHAIDVFWRMRQ